MRELDRENTGKTAAVYGCYRPFADVKGTGSVIDTGILRVLRIDHLRFVVW
jgi:hypothetical protein